MAAGYTVLTIDKGAKFDKTIEITDSNNVPVDLTGYTGVCSAALSRTYLNTGTGATGPTSLSFPITVTIESPPTLGKIRLTLTTAQTSTIAIGRYIFILTLVVAGEAERYIDGIIVVN